MNRPIDYLLSLLAQHVPAVQIADILAKKGFTARPLANDQRIAEAAQYVVKDGKIDGQPVHLSLVFKKEDGSFFPMAPLSLDEGSLFPDKNKVGSFGQLCDHFKKQLEKLPENLPERLLEETLIHLVRASFGSCAVSAEHPDVSLAEYLRLTAAIASAIDRSKAIEKPLIFMAAGIGNIQEFCFDLMSNKAGKSMKGRSFYLQLLMDTLVQRLLRDDRLAATSGHLVYARGGKLQMVLSNNRATQDALAEIRAEVELTIFNKHKTSLNIWLVDDLKFGLEDMKSGNLWPALYKKTTSLKSRKLETLLKNQFNTVFEVIQEGFDSGDPDGPQLCQASGDIIRNPTDDENRLNVDSVDERAEDAVWVDKIVKDQAQLGRDLQKAKWMVFFDFPAKKGFDELLDGALTKCLFDNKGLNDLKVDSGLYIKALNKTDFIPETVCPKAAMGFQFYGGNEQAWNEQEGRAKQFNELAKFDENNPGQKFTRLGVLRMDIDGLGDLLTNAQKQNPYFGFNGTISARLDLFFSGHLNNVRHKYKDFLNLTYSGGDDLMAIGHWEDCFMFANQVRGDFQRFANGNTVMARPNFTINDTFSDGQKATGLTISAGVALVSAKFPIAKATKLSGDALQDEAKELCGKNAFALLGEAVSWHLEFDWVQDCKDKLVNFVQTGQLKAGFLQQLQLFQTVKNCHLHTKGQIDLSFIWHSMYYLSRHEKLLKGYPDAQHFVLELRMLLLKAMQNDGRVYDLLALAARWAELQIRASETTN